MGIRLTGLVLGHYCGVNSPYPWRWARSNCRMAKILAVGEFSMFVACFPLHWAFSNGYFLLQYLCLLLELIVLPGLKKQPKAIQSASHWEAQEILQRAAQNISAFIKQTGMVLRVWVSRSWEPSCLECDPCHSHTYGPQTIFQEALV